MDKRQQEQLSEIILKRRKELLERKQKEGKSFDEMIAAIDEEFNQLNNEYAIVSFKQKTSLINQLDEKIAEKVDEKKEYTQIVLDYLDAENQNNKRIDYLVISGFISIFMGALLISELSIFPIIVYSVAATVGIVQLKNIIKQEKKKKAFKLEFFGDDCITKTEIEDSLIEKNIQISNDLENLNRQKNDLGAQLNEEKEMRRLILSKQLDLSIDKEILNLESISADESQNIENIVEKLQIYANQLSRTEDLNVKSVENNDLEKMDDKPKVQSKRYKRIDRKSN